MWLGLFFYLYEQLIGFTFGPLVKVDLVLRIASLGLGILWKYEHIQLTSFFLN